MDVVKNVKAVGGTVLLSSEEGGFLRDLEDSDL